MHRHLLHYHRAPAPTARHRPHGRKGSTPPPSPPAACCCCCSICCRMLSGRFLIRYNSSRRPCTVPSSSACSAGRPAASGTSLQCKAERAHVGDYPLPAVCAFVLHEWGTFKAGCWLHRAACCTLSVHRAQRPAQCHPAAAQGSQNPPVQLAQGNLEHRVLQAGRGERCKLVAVQRERSPPPLQRKVQLLAAPQHTSTSGRQPRSAPNKAHAPECCC